MQEGVHQHGTMAVGEHKAIAVSPLGILRIMFEEIIPQHFGDVCHAHRCAGVAAVGFLHRIHTQGADGIGKLAAGGAAGHGEPQKGWLFEGRYSPCSVGLGQCFLLDYLDKNLLKKR
jgi:hypothetical protein